MSPAPTMLRSESTATCPAVNTSLPVRTPSEYGPITRGRPSSPPLTHWRPGGSPGAVLSLTGASVALLRDQVDLDQRAGEHDPRVAVLLGRRDEAHRRPPLDRL